MGGEGIAATLYNTDNTIDMIKKCLILLLTTVVLGGGVAAAQVEDDLTWSVAPLPAVDVAGLPADRASNPKLDSALAALAEAGNRAATAETFGLRYEGGRVQVKVIAGPDGADAARAAIAQTGGEVTDVFGDALQAWLPPAQLTALAAQPAVAAVRAPDLAVPAANSLLADDRALAATTEGVTKANANVWHAAGWRGQGVTIAVIDAGFVGYPDLLGSDLPQNVVVKNFVDGQNDSQVDTSTAHGTACAEIVHDMAPLATLYLLKISTDLDLSQAVNYAIGQGVDVISTSLTFVNVTPGDGTGRFATLAQQARDAGILWVTAAGNYRETHWSGAFVDSDGDALHEFAPGVEVNVFGPGNNTGFLIPAGVSLNPSIRWDDWTAVNQDYRLLLLRYNGTNFEIVASSNNAQTGLSGQRPTERISYVTGGQPSIYGVAIQRAGSTRDVHLHLITPNRELDRRTPTMSLGNLADVAAVMTTAAVDVDVPFVREQYSSEGPTNGPGGTPGGGQLKPNMAAFANVSTASYGPRIFNGTSAATPHVAGAAAQALSAYPDALPGEVQDFLQSRALDQGPVGADPQFGFGRLYLAAPPDIWDYPYHLFIPSVVQSP